METIFKLDLRFDTYIRGMGVGAGTRPIRHFHISHNAPHFPPKIVHNLCFSFLSCITGRGRGGQMRCITGNVEVEMLRMKNSQNTLPLFRATLSILLPCLGRCLVLKPYIGIPKEQIHIIVIAFVYLE